MRSIVHTPDSAVPTCDLKSASEETKSVASAGNLTRSRIKIWFLYAADWAVAILAVVISQLILIPLPHSVSFVVTDPSIQQKFTDGSRVSTERVCVVLCTAVPVVIMVLWLSCFRRPVHEIHQALLGLAMAMSFCILFTSIYSQVAVILAPDFLDKCNLRQDDFDRSLRTGVALSYRDCQNSDIRRELRAYPTAVVTGKPSQMIR
ncbi:hypothetical protein J3B02_002700 [Coemansia erecta]|nr:hypothetical protein J3B02_002700 [Coemansia erecta]